MYKYLAKYCTVLVSRGLLCGGVLTHAVDFRPSLFCIMDLCPQPGFCNEYPGANTKGYSVSWNESCSNGLRYISPVVRIFALADDGQVFSCLPSVPLTVDVRDSNGVEISSTFGPNGTAARTLYVDVQLPQTQVNGNYDFDASRSIPGRNNAVSTVDSEYNYVACPNTTPKTLRTCSSPGTRTNTTTSCTTPNKCFLNVAPGGQLCCQNAPTGTCNCTPNYNGTMASPAQYQCNGATRQQWEISTNDCGGRWVDNACPATYTCDATAPNYCKPPTVSCDGTVGGGCNASSPPANGSCSVAPACNYQCNNGFAWDSAACVPTFHKYVCMAGSCGAGYNGSAGSWVGVTYCSAIKIYNPGTVYSRGYDVCLVPPVSAPNNADCQNTCVPSFSTCGTNSNTCGAPDSPLNFVAGGAGGYDTWTCGPNSCSYYNPTVPTNGACSNPLVYNTCNAGSAANGNGSTFWQCQGINGGSTADCVISATAQCNNNFSYGDCYHGTITNYNASGNPITWQCVAGASVDNCSYNIVVPPRCGDNIQNQSYGIEECDGTDGLAGYANTACNGSCQRICQSGFQPNPTTTNCTPVYPPITEYSCVKDSSNPAAVLNSLIKHYRNSFGVREPDVVEQYNIGGSYCCQGARPNGQLVPGNTVGGNKSNFSCAGQTLNREQDSGQCSRNTASQNCSQIFDFDGTPYQCNIALCGNTCCAKAELRVQANYCLLTGAANTYTGCLLSLPVNRPAAGYTTGGYDPNAYTPPNVSNARCPGGDCRPSEQEITASLYNSVGGLLEGNKAMQSNGNNRSVRFEGYSAGTYNINVGNIGSGWVLITGGSAMNPNHVPGSGAPTNYIGTRPWYSQGLHSWNGVTSFGLSSVVSNGLTASFSSAPRGTAYFYYRCPSGACPLRKELHVNVVRDSNNNGFGTSQYSDESNLGNVVVELRTMPGDTFYASGVTQANTPTNNNASIGYWNNNGFRGGFASGLVGIKVFAVDSDTTYKVIIYPPLGYSIPAGAPYHQVQQDIVVTDQTDPYGNYYATSNFGNVGQGARNVTWSSLSGTAYTVTVPRDDDVYARTRFIGNQYDTSLTASIVNAASGYVPGSTMQVRYRLKNEGYASYNPSIEISIMTGLVPTGNAILSGTCPSYKIATSGLGSGRNYGYYPSNTSDSTWGAFKGSSVNLGNGCDDTTNWGEDGGRCNNRYAEGMFITYDHGGTFRGTYYPNTTTDKYPGDPSSSTTFNYDVIIGREASSDTRRPNGYGVYMGVSGSKTASSGLVAGGLCDIIITYTVGGVIGQTYRSRACSIPQNDDFTNADEMDDIVDGNITMTRDNCSNIDYTIGLPSCTLPAELSGALVVGSSPAVRLAGGAAVLPGSGVVAWYDDLVTPGESNCQSQIRTCTNGSMDGSWTGVNCIQQCVHTWSGNGQTIGITPGSVVNGWETLVATRAKYNCQCRQGPIECAATLMTDGSGRQYLGGNLSGALDTYIYPASPICQPLTSDCAVTCVGNEEDLYEVHYTMSGNTVLNSGTRVIDQVHPNICLKVDTFTGRIASNEVSITFYSGNNTSYIYPGFSGISNSGLSSNTGLANTVGFTSPTNGLFYSGYICGPYVEYNFKKPLYPGAEGYFFYQYKLKESISNNTNANSGSNCIWIYRYFNTNFFNQTPFSALASSIDLGDAASRFVNNYATFSKFNPTTGELYDTNTSSRNRVCVPPPTSICAATPLLESFSIPLNLCGNGVQEIGEQCDKGHAPYVLSGRNDNAGGSGSRFGLSDVGGGYDDPLYGNYCKTDCTFGIPLVCNWEAECSNDNIKSIQEGEEYPFWWDLGQVLAPGDSSNTGFTRQCASSTDAGKLMYGGAFTNDILCTFNVTNGLSTGGTFLTGFTVPCFGTGVAANLPMFNLSGDRLINERSSLPLTTTQGNSGSSVQTDFLANKGINTLAQFRTRVTSSQGSYLVSLGTGVTRGQLGEYKISLTNIQYSRCNEKKTYLGSGGYAYVYTVETGSEYARVCSNRFIVTRPYIIQEGSLLSTLTGTSFSDFYTDAKRLVDQTAVGTFSTSIGINNTQVPTYISMIGTDESQGKAAFVNKFIDKYTQLAASNGVTVDYNEGRNGIAGVATNNYKLRKVVTRDIYVYTGTTQLVLSDSSMNSSSMATNLTIISPNADVIIFGNLTQRNIMVLTKQNLTFAGGSLSSDSQEVRGIFASNGYGGSTLKNNNRSNRWIDDGRLVIKGMVIGTNINNLSNMRRSVIKDWYDGTLDELGGSALIAAKRKKLIDGASLRISPNPQLFVSPPPGATELIQSLSVAK